MLRSLNNFLNIPLAATLNITIDIFSAFWMLVEGLRLYWGTSNKAMRYGAYSKRRATFYMIVGWGIPTCIILLFGAIGWTLERYMKENYLYTAQKHLEAEGKEWDLSVRRYDTCWLDPTSPIYISSVTIPVAIVLIFNLWITCKVGLWPQVASNKVGLLK